MKLIQNRLRFCEAFKALLNEPHKIGIRLPASEELGVGLLRYQCKLDIKGGKMMEKLYYTNDASDLYPHLGADELLSEEWETYEV